MNTIICIAADLAGFILEINSDVTESAWFICTEDFFLFIMTNKISDSKFCQL